LTPDALHLFDRTTLARMKPTAMLINTARADHRGRRTPWRPDNPLLHLPNTAVTPHAAGYSEESLRAVRTIAAQGPSGS
jgi:D-3-phosphoglycerate dehydrogenase